MTASRSAVRKALAALFKAQSTMTENVFSYLPSDFGGASPVICITGAGSERPKLTSRGTKNTFHFAVETFTLYADPTSVPPWTPEDAEDAMDALEEDVATIVMNNPTGSLWQFLSYETVSTISKVAIGGVSYLYEVIPLIVEVL
jgi:hypothetical protein